MKHVLRYLLFSITNKIRCEVRCIINDIPNSIYYHQHKEGEITDSLSLRPFITVTILRDKREFPGWLISDTLGLNKVSYPTFVKELKKMQETLKISDMYQYKEDPVTKFNVCLGVNEELANRHRQIFKPYNSQIMVEITPTATEFSDRVYGVATLTKAVKIKFNNEESSVVLNEEEFDALVSSLDKADMDMITLHMYQQYYKPTAQKLDVVKTVNSQDPKVDIVLPGVVKSPAEVKKEEDQKRIFENLSKEDQL